MNQPSSSTSRSGIGFFDLLFITFLVLKLTKIISWSWWWVTAPLWGPLALIVAVLLFVGLVMMVKAIVKSQSNKRKLP